jgi:hypothetical protein
MGRSVAWHLEGYIKRATWSAWPIPTTKIAAFPFHIFMLEHKSWNFIFMFGRIVCVRACVRACVRGPLLCMLEKDGTWRSGSTPRLSLEDDSNEQPPPAGDCTQGEHVDM